MRRRWCMAPCGLRRARARHRLGRDRTGLSGMLLLVLVGDAAFGLDYAARHVERGGPHALDHLSQRVESLRSRSVQPSSAVSTFADEASVFQHGQMLGNRGAMDVEVSGNLAGGE